MHWDRFPGELMRTIRAIFERPSIARARIIEGGPDAVAALAAGTKENEVRIAGVDASDRSNNLLVHL